MKKKMFLGASNLIFENAKKLRYSLTHAELILWGYLKQRQLGFKFRRQHPIAQYIADFYCHELKLIIEVDGDVHTDVEVMMKDKERKIFLEANNIHFLRFANNEVENDIEAVINKIENHLNSYGQQTGDRY